MADLDPDPDPLPDPHSHPQTSAAVPAPADAAAGGLPARWHALRDSMRHLVAFGGLRAMWSGQPAAAIVESFADALLGLVHARLVLVRLPDASAEVLEVLRTAEGGLTRPRARRAARRLAPLLIAENVGARLRIPSPVGRGPLSLVVVPLGHETLAGFVAVGSPAAGFPDELERALLGVATGQAAVALREREQFELATRERAEEALREGASERRALDDSPPATST